MNRIVNLLALMLLIGCFSASGQEVRVPPKLLKEAPASDRILLSGVGGVWGPGTLADVNYWNLNGSNLNYLAGGVGLNTATPAYLLDVRGNARITDSLFVGIALGIGSTTADEPLSIYDNEPSIFLRDMNATASASRMRIDGNGGTFTFRYVNASGGGNDFLAFDRSGSGDLTGMTFWDFITPSVHIDNSGTTYFNVSDFGIGTSTPSYKFDVTGSGRFTDSLFVGDNLGVGTTSPSFGLEATGTVGFTGLTEDNSVDSLLAITPSGQLYMRGVSSISSGGGADNLGDHTATQNIELDDNWLSNDGGNEGIRVDNSGKVGIGTGSPDELLTVNDGDLLIKRTGAGNRATLSLSHGDATGDFNLQQDAVGNAIFDNLAGSNLHYVGTGVHQFNVGGSEIARLTSTGLGVGATSLEAKLDVQGGSLGGTVGDVVQTLSLRAESSNQDRLRFRVERESTGTDWTTARQYIQRQVDGTPMGYMAFGSQSDDVITWGVGSLERMRLDQNGSIGINETDPAARLHVGGTNTAIRVGSGSDYFEIEDNTDQVKLEKINATGAPFIDVNPAPGDGISNASVRFFRETNTTGTVGIEIKKGDGTNTNQHILRGNDNSSFAIDNSNVGIGTASPTEKFHVVGNSLFDGTMYADYDRGLVYWENNANDNADGAGVTLRTSTNPGSGSAAGSIFAVRSSGQAPRLWVGQALTSAGANDFAVGLPTTGSEANTGAYSIYMDASEGSVKADYYRFMPQGSPPTGLEGNVYYDSTDDELKYHDGSGYQSLGGSQVVWSFHNAQVEATDDGDYLELTGTGTGVSLGSDNFYRVTDETSLEIIASEGWLQGTFSGSNLQILVRYASTAGGSLSTIGTFDIDDLDEVNEEVKTYTQGNLSPGFYAFQVESSGMSNNDELAITIRFYK